MEPEGRDSRPRVMREQLRAEAALRRSGATALALLMCGVAACGKGAEVVSSAGDVVRSRGPSTEPAEDRRPTLPAGWRWESYGGIQVGVPDDWGWGNSSQRLSQWCIASNAEVAQPIVGRPGPATLVGCSGEERSPAPETLIRNTGQVVGFGRGEVRSPGVAHEGDRTTVRLGGVSVTIQAPPALRRRIAETVHPVKVDLFGCRVTHPISAHPAWRPEPADVASLTQVSAVSACKYQLAQDPSWPEARLLSSLRMEGSAAARTIQHLAKAPLGGGPDNPDLCLPGVSHGDEIIILRVRSSAGLTEVVLRYSGCNHNGFDDGVSVRSLTAAAVAPFVTGPNVVFSFDGPREKLPILRPDLKSG